METKRKNRTREMLEGQSGPDGQPGPAEVRYCAFCGTELKEGRAASMRFGEPFCSEAHAEAFVGEVRASRAEVAAHRPAGEAPGAPGDTGAAPQGQGRWDLKRWLKLGACCGLPLLALVVLAGGGGALLGGAAALLPTLALLACPLGMFFMMRAMRREGGGAEHGQGDSKHPRGDVER